MKTQSLTAMIHEQGGPSGPPRILKKWALLLLGIMAIILFVTQVVPAAAGMSSIRAAVTAIRESDIEAGAYFYTDVEKIREAELYVRHSFQFPQRRAE